MSLPYLQPYLGLSNGLNTLHAAGVGGGVGGWVELGRTTLSGVADTISVSSLSNKRYYMLLTDAQDSGALNPVIRINNDTGSNYAQRLSNNGGAEGASTSLSYLTHNVGVANATDRFGVVYFANYSSKEKLGISHITGQGAAGAGTAPIRQEAVFKWANTSNAINQFSFVNLGSGDLASGSELVVLGYDPLDSHTNNFWEELASVELGGTADEISSGTISAKKYLWVQAWFKASGDTNQAVQFNNDTSGNYANRGSYDGGADGTSTSSAYAIANYGSAMNTSCFMNMFIINNASTEKLVICHIVDQEASGAGTAPHRQEQVGKWANTSNQITEIDIKNTDTGDYAAGSLLKVWGAD